MKLRFGEFVLDTGARALTRAGSRVTLEPQVYSCIELLARQAGVLTSTEQLHAVLWPGVSVGSGSLRRTIREARKALGDDGSSQVVIRTRKGLGYEFVLEVIDDSRSRTSRAGWPFVGRERELRFLREWLATPHAGGLCFVSGEAGAGKSSLLAQLSAASAERCWLTGRCHSALGQPAFWPFRELGQQVLEDPSLRAPARALIAQRPELLRLIPELAGGEPTLPLAAAASSELRFELAERLGSFLRALSRVRPLVLAFEDLHWADEGSLVLLEALARAARDQNLYLLATYRPEALAVNAALAALIARASGRASAVSLDLQPLGLEAVRALLEALKLATGASAAQSLWRRTGGNALFVHELVHHARATGLSIGSSLPPSLQQILAARFENLPPITVERLGQAAVLGDVFDLDALAALSRNAAAQLDLDLDPALLAGLVRRSDDAPATLRFSHALVRDALLRLLPPHRLQDHHRAAVSVLSGQPPSATTRARLALHAFEAGSLVPIEERRRLCEQAGREALAMLAFERAALQLDRALQLTAADDHTPEAAELALAAAWARWHADETESAVEAAFFAAADRSRRAGAAALLGEAAIGLALGDQSSLALRHTYLRPKTLDLLDEAWQKLSANGRTVPRRLAYRLASSLCFVQAEAGELAGTRSAAARALELAPDDLDPIGRLWHSFLGVFAEPERALAHLNQIEQGLRAQELDPRHRCEILPLLMAARLGYGQLAGWERAAAAAIRSAALLPQTPRPGRAGARLSIYLGIELCTPVTRAVIAGRLAEADMLWQAATQRAEQLGFTRSRESDHTRFTFCSSSTATRAAAACSNRGWTNAAERTPKAAGSSRSSRRSSRSNAASSRRPRNTSPSCARPICSRCSARAGCLRGRRPWSGWPTRAPKSERPTTRTSFTGCSCRARSRTFRTAR